MAESILILGLDLGIASVGWALLRVVVENGDILSGEIVADGVRIFPSTTEGAKNEPKNRARRTARGIRRLLRRKAQRQKKIKSILQTNGLLPTFGNNSESEFEALGNPFELRAKGVTEKLEGFDFGRAITHLLKRRGFKSNRKSGNSKDDGVVYTGIAEIREEMRNSEFITLGSYLNSKEKKRGRYTAREMIEDEFDQIWETQSRFNPGIFTDYLRTDLKNVAFYQRPISSQRGKIGKCTFEAGKKRCDIARQDAQRIRYWQDINNIKIQDRRTLDTRTLTIEQKFTLAEILENLKKNELSEAELRSVLKIGPTDRINLEKKIKGNTTANKFQKAIGPKWDSMSAIDQERLTDDFIRIEHEPALENRLRDFWKFNDKEVEKLLKLELEPGYSRCSLKAIKKILPKMKDGLRYDEAASAIYGDHRGKSPGGELNQLPPPPSDLRNPIVKKALGEMRKVVNAIIREYGKPDQIRLEMARDLKLTKKQKERADAQRKKNETANKEAVDFYTKLHQIDPDSISGTDKLKYRLAKEANWICPYTQDPIPPESLRGDQWDKEHIIPYSRCFDDSYMNLTICQAEFNRKEKLNKTPFEIFGADDQKWFELGERIANLPFAKRRRFEQKEVKTDEMIGRMLSDTRYICREARGYLRQLYRQDNDENKFVQVVAGGSTAKLRHAWGINAILSLGNIEVKNRLDHRHHAIDAIVIALTSRALFQHISKLASRNEESRYRELKGLEMPWDRFRDDVKESMENLIVSHAPTRRIRGEMLEKTAYGPTPIEGVFTRRIRLESLTVPKPKKGQTLADSITKLGKSIPDKNIRHLVTERLHAFDGDVKKAFVEPLYLDHTNPEKKNVGGKTLIQGVKVRVNISKDSLVGIKDKDGKIYKYYPLAGNHHVDVFENADGERKAVLIPRFYAAQRNWKPADLGPEWTKLFSLCANDYVEFRGDDGELKVLRIQKMSGGGTVVIIGRPLEDARSEYVAGVVKQLQGANLKRITRKLQVDPLGRLTQARD